MSDAAQTGASSSVPSASHTMTSGILLSLAATPLVLLGPLEVVKMGPVPRSVLAVTASLLLLVAASIIEHRARIAIALVNLTVSGIWLSLLPTWATRPSATLASLLLIVLGGKLFFWNTSKETSPLEIGLRRAPGRLRGAVLGALLSWIIWVANDAPRGAPSIGPIMWASVVALLFGAMRASSTLRTRPFRSSAVLLTYVATAATIFLVRREIFWIVTLPVGLATVTALAVRRPPNALLGQEAWWEPLLGHPERLLVGTFAALSVAGGLGLSLPIAARDGSPLSGIDAFFTSVSAVCVTGLITVDTPVALSRFGQALVLLLIQVGGLGIMTFSTAILWAVGGRMSLRHEGAVASLISTHDRGRLFDTARRIVLLTVAVESAGTLILWLLFTRAGDSVGQAFWRALFTSISAFCNAGFALQTDSLLPYQQDAFLLHTVGILIILGGLSPLAIFALVPLVRRSVTPVLAQAKLALAAAAVLLVGGFAFFLAFEWNASLRDLSVVDKLHNAWFQSVTLRTAGFNSVDLSLIHPATLALTLIWMFIGGSPGGTAGGIKTTTAAVLLLGVIQSIRGRTSLEVFGRLIPDKTRVRATAVVAISAGMGTVALVIILLTQAMTERQAVFEVVSALGTVGLSIGGTAQLDSVGKLVIMICMFVGRVGGLSLLMFLSARKFVARVGRPLEEVDVG